MPQVKCPRCFKGGYAKERSEADRRPLFRCNHCGHIWTCGLDGGEYLTKAEKAAFAAQPSRSCKPPEADMSLIDDIKPQVTAALAAALGDALDCTRVWEAWSVGTMSADDFELVSSDPDRLNEIVEAVLAPLRSVERDLTKQNAEKIGMEMGRCCHGKRMDRDCPACDEMSAETSLPC